MKSKLYLIVTIVLFHYSCKNEKNRNIENVIVKAAKECDKETECIVDIKKLTNFNWDEMYVFNYPVSLEVVENAIQQPYPYYEEFSRPFIFLKDKNIVHYENNPSNIEGLLDGQVIFDFGDSLRYKGYNRNEAIYNIKKKDFKKGVYYELKER